MIIQETNPYISYLIIIRLRVQSTDGDTSKDISVAGDSCWIQIKPNPVLHLRKNPLPEKFSLAEY